MTLDKEPFQVTPRTTIGAVLSQRARPLRWLVKALTAVLLLLVAPPGAEAKKQETVSLTVRVDALRNSKGVVQFSLYNKKGSIPDEKFERFYRQKVMAVTEKSSWAVFENLPKGTYAVTIHHDEDRDGKIDKGIILPTEGVGVSNYDSIGLTNRPNFSGASFKVAADMKKSVKIIYF